MAAEILLREPMTVSVLLYLKVECNAAQFFLKLAEYRQTGHHGGF